MFDILNLKLDKNVIAGRRKEVSTLLMMQSGNIRSGSINSMSEADLELLFRLYDEIFFESWFRDNYKGKFKFSLSKRMTKSAGLTICPKNSGRIRPEELVLEIRIGVDFFFCYDSVEESKSVGGVETKSSLEALQLVFEHELCHAIEFIHFGKSSCKGKRFKTLAANLFGHTESFHRLPTNKQIAQKTLGLNIGDTVSFTFEGRKMAGILYGINKRATVMVRDKNGNMMDGNGVRYSKYYVPLGLLK